MEKVTDFLFFGSKITVDGDCSHSIKRHLLFGRKAMTNLDCVLKSRDITFPTKVHVVKAMVISIVMYRCKSWTIRRLSTKSPIEVLEKTLESYLGSTKINPVILKGNQS